MFPPLFELVGVVEDRYYEALVCNVGWFGRVGDGQIKTSFRIYRLIVI